jgi:hypothetical protein
MKRTPILRHTPLRRTGRVNPRNAARRASEFARAYGSTARVVWIQGLACVGCGRTPCENAHSVTGGRGRKADAETIAPLCHDCRTRYDQHRTPFDVPECRELVKAAAAEVARRWQRTGGDA